MTSWCRIVVIRLSERGAQLRSFVHTLGQTANAVALCFSPDGHSALQFLNLTFTLPVAPRPMKFSLNVSFPLKQTTRVLVHPKLYLKFKS